MRRILIVTALWVVAGCNEPAQAPAPTPSGQLSWMDVPGHPVIPLPDPDEQEGHVGRAPRRLTVAQLRISIEVATGRKWAPLDVRGASLGEADFALVRSETADANLVFAKFLEDGARDVCLDAATADAAAVQADRILSPETSTPLNLVYLSTRFWGSPLQGDELVRWSSFAESVKKRAEAVGKPQQAWAAVCVAMMTDSRFLTY